MCGLRGLSEEFGFYRERWERWRVLTIREWESQNREGEVASRACGCLVGGCFVPIPQGTLECNYISELSTHTPASSPGKEGGLSNL